MPPAVHALVLLGVLGALGLPARAATPESDRAPRGAGRAEATLVQSEVMRSFLARWAADIRRAEDERDLEGSSDEGAPLLRPRRSDHHASMDPKFLHLPMAALDHLPDGDHACQAMRNASALRQVVPVVVEPPCPVRLKPLLDPQRVWPLHLLEAECACPSASCRPRTAHTCTQVFSPVIVMVLDDDGALRRYRRHVASGCRCMAARATLAEEIPEDYD